MPLLFSTVHSQSFNVQYYRKSSIKPPRGLIYNESHCQKYLIDLWEPKSNKNKILIP